MLSVMDPETRFKERDMKSIKAAFSDHLLSPTDFCGTGAIPPRPLLVIDEEVITVETARVKAVFICLSKQSFSYCKCQSFLLFRTLLLRILDNRVFHPEPHSVQHCV